MRLPRKDGLNIIPFIDIMLVLLAIVLSISTFIAYGNIKIHLPSTQMAQSHQKEKERIIIAVDQANRIYMNDQNITLAQLSVEFSKIKQETLIELKHDKESKFELFINMIDLLKKNNHENFSIATTLQ
jgi:biopolymer transport protein ExbD